jgi:upstream activation factor subunit UAF30
VATASPGSFRKNKKILSFVRVFLPSFEFSPAPGAAAVYRRCIGLRKGADPEQVLSTVRFSAGRRPIRKSTEIKMAKNPAGEGKSATANSAFMKPLQPSKELAAIVGAAPLARSEVVSKVWEYIKANSLQNPENKREILADDKLEGVFGKKKVTMFEMNKHLAQHLK